MPDLKQFHGKSQYDTDIDPKYRNSACGPVTASVILRHLDVPLAHVPIDKLYKWLGTTRIGLFTWRFVHRLQRLLGPDWLVEKCTIADVLTEIDQGRPVAAKFDKWFSYQWSGHYSFDYHWVPIIGYKRMDASVLLILHDNGSPSSCGSVRVVPYEANQKILTFIKIAPRTRTKGH